MTAPLSYCCPLPRELQWIAYDYLPFREIIKIHFPSLPVSQRDRNLQMQNYEVYREHRTLARDTAKTSNAAKALSSPHITSQYLKTLAASDSLTELSLASMRQIKDADIFPFSETSSLRTLSIYNCQQLTDAGISSLARNPSLTNLSLASLDKLTDRGLLPFAESASLTTLSLSNFNRSLHISTTPFALPISLHTLSLTKITVNDVWIAPVTQAVFIHSLTLSAVIGPTDVTWSRLCRNPFILNLEILELTTDLSRGHPHDQVKASLSHLPKSQLGTFYQAVLREADNLETLFKQLDDDDRSWINEYIPQGLSLLSPKINRHELVKTAILAKWDNMQSKDDVSRELSRLGAQPHDSSRKNLCLLADAMQNVQNAP
jgi:hypothetical protein